jgi:hypothetical protein
MNAAGILTDVDSQQVVGRMHGLPIVTDPNLPVNLGTGNDEDPIFVMRASDLVLFESGIRARSCRKRRLRRSPSFCRCIRTSATPPPVSRRVSGKSRASSRQPSEELAAAR